MSILLESFDLKDDKASTKPFLFQSFLKIPAIAIKLRIIIWEAPGDILTSLESPNELHCT